jgi:phosphoribosyl 1,2-cyclic phosphodiesterase
VWGTRGSLATPGPETNRYGGNTACVEVRADDGSVLVLDAGTGVRRLGRQLADDVGRVDLLLTHLHMDHIQGLGFFAPLYVPGLEVHVWGPASTTLDLRTRLGRYMSPPLFPVRLRDLPCALTVHEVPGPTARIGAFTVESALVCHPDATVGFRIQAGRASVAYLPDHEPALGVRGPLRNGGWTSGHGLAAGVDLLIHDAQYSEAQYRSRIGWGHSTMRRAVEFAALAEARALLLFHHDPEHDDAAIDSLVAETIERTRPDFPVHIAAEGLSFELAEA